MVETSIKAKRNQFKKLSILGNGEQGGGVAKVGPKAKEVRPCGLPHRKGGDTLTILGKEKRAQDF